MRTTFSDIEGTNKNKVQRIYLSQTMKNETEATLRKTIRSGWSTRSSEQKQRFTIVIQAIF